MGTINPPRRTIGVGYTIIVINYLKRWGKPTLVKDCIAATSARLLFDNVVTQFGCPKILMSNQGAHFINQEIRAMTK